MENFVALSAQLRGDFSAISDGGTATAQPIIEKRFSQLKTDFCVAPVYLKNVGRIVALLAVYFFAWMVQTLLERELRRAMKQQRLSTPCRSIPRAGPASGPRRGK